MPQNRRVELPDCRVLLRRLSSEEIVNYLAVRDVGVAVNEWPNNEAEINIVLARENSVNINDIVNPRVNPPRRVLPPSRRHADVPDRVMYRTALLYGTDSVETVPMNGEVETYIAYKVVTKRVLLVTDSHGRELHHLLERSSEYSVTAIVSPNGTLNYIVDNALLYEDNFDEVIVMAGTNDISDEGYVNNDFNNALGKLIKLSKLNNLSIINLPRRRDAVSPAVHRARASLNATLKNINCANFIDISNFKRDFFTSHGLHMNMHGKHELAAVILNAIGVKSEKKIIFTFHEQVRRIRRPKN
ncbi:hypothetical protein J6590_064914 [Homalodisca vitripennis]|nr:hypothetical protein J6590_064914 [Homalodisca vitripennis]